MLNPFTPKVAPQPIGVRHRRHVLILFFLACRKRQLGRLSRKTLKIEAFYGTNKTILVQRPQVPSIGLYFAALNPMVTVPFEYNIFEQDVKQITMYYTHLQ